MNYLERVKELERERYSPRTNDADLYGEKSVLSEKSPYHPDQVSDKLLSRLQAGTHWLTVQHQAWLDNKPLAANDERFSKALASWSEMERSLRVVYGYEGCVMGPGQRCPGDAPVICDACLVDAKTKQMR